MTSAVSPLCEMAMTRVFLSTNRKSAEFGSHDDIAKSMPYFGKHIPADEAAKREEPQATKNYLTRPENIDRHPVQLTVILHQGLADNSRLFFDFFDHKMRVITLSGFRQIPRYVNRCPLFGDDGQNRKSEKNFSS